MSKTMSFISQMNKAEAFAAQLRREQNRAYAQKIKRIRDNEMTAEARRREYHNVWVAREWWMDEGD